MKKTMISIAAAFAVLGGAAFGEECTLEAQAPTMPDPAAATAEARTATIAAIKDYQTALGEYRECLDKTIDDKKLKKKVRQVAIDAFNATVEQEEELVAAWQEFDGAYGQANS